jgi:hypothetical protein
MPGHIRVAGHFCLSPCSGLESDRAGVSSLGKDQSAETNLATEALIENEDALDDVAHRLELDRIPIDFLAECCLTASEPHLATASHVLAHFLAAALIRLVVERTGHR